MNSWITTVLTLSTALLLLLLWKEWTRNDTSFRSLRLLASLLAVIALALLSFPIKYNSQQRKSPREAVVLTDGFIADSIIQLLSSRSDSIPILSLVNSTQNIASHKVEYLADASLLQRQYKDVTAFHVFGFGLNNDELKRIDKAHLIFHPSPLLAGFTSIHWQQQVASGETLFIQGKYENTSSFPAKIILSSFGQTVDSTIILPGKNSPFTIKTVPKNIGRFTYSLHAILNNDTVENEIIPVQVIMPQSLKILMLASSPEFNFKFLKNDFAQQGYAVATRANISKNKYAFDYNNVDERPLNSITSKLLDSFDIVVTDANELAFLSRQELFTVMNHVEQKGMGLIIEADTTLPSAFYNLPFKVNAITPKAQQEVRVYLQDSTQMLPAVSCDQFVYLRNFDDLQPILLDKEKKIYAGSTLYGLGKVVVTTLPNTYTWVLAGNENAYRRVWSTILSKAAPTTINAETWSISPSLPTVDEAAEIHLQTSVTSIPDCSVNSSPVYLESNPGLPFQWKGLYFPSKEAWQEVTSSEGEPVYWYVYSSVRWQTLKAYDNVSATKQFIFSSSKKKELDSNLIIEKEFPKIYLFLMLLFSVGFLWAESKKLFRRKA